MTRYNRQDYKTAIPQIEGDVNVIQEWISSALDFFYPVGTIYETSNVDFNPNKIWGGTWEKIEGKMLVGLDTDDTDFDTVGETGGEKTHTLTENEMPNHYHSYVDERPRTSVGAKGSADYKVGIESVSKNTDTSGGGLAHNNMPPYEVVVIWKRIS